MGERAPHEVRERVWVEKFDHSGDEPKLVETTFVQRTRKVAPDGTETVETVTEEPKEGA